MKDLRQVTFQWYEQGVLVGIAYNPKGANNKWSRDYYSLDNGKYTEISRYTNTGMRGFRILDYTGAYYRKVLRRINCEAGTEYNHQI